MGDIRVEKLADLMVNYSVAVKPGDKVVIQGETSGEPLIKEVYAKVLQAGGNPRAVPHRITEYHDETLRLRRAALDFRPLSHECQCPGCRNESGGL